MPWWGPWCSSAQVAIGRRSPVRMSPGPPFDYPFPLSRFSGVLPETMWLDEDSLEPDQGEPARIEQPAAVKPRPLSPKDPEDRIRTALGVRSGDEPIPRVSLATLRRYYRHLVAHLTFPFPGKLASAIGPHQDTTSPVSVLRLPDANRYSPEGGAGLICKALQNGKRIEYPLDRIIVRRGDPNRQLVEDYSYWLA